MAMEQDPWLRDFVRHSALPASFGAEVEALHRPFANRITERARRHGPGFVVGLCGPQGSGKSTTVEVLAHLLRAADLTVAVLSLDDLYLPRESRARLAREVHPLLQTRGPPGTHDVALGLDVLNGLTRAGPTLIPRFDKGTDDRKPRGDWDQVEGPVDVILFEGWCVGARPQPTADLIPPINALERDEDRQGVWRAYVNNALAGPYQTLFARIDLFALMQPPSFAVVEGWRLQQEHKLRLARGEGAGVMNDAEVRRFVSHFERITRWLIAEAPARADVVIRLDANRRAAPPVWRA